MMIRLPLIGPSATRDFFRRLPCLTVPLGTARAAFDVTWLAILPLAVWAIAVLYVPVLAPSVQGLLAWGLGVAVAALVVLSLLVHAFAHVLAARLVSCPVPQRVPVFAFGDAAQVWPSAASPWREAAAALGGPLASLGLAGGFLGVWVAASGEYVVALALVLAVFNLVVAIINATPAYPFAGGRVARAICWRVTGTPRFGDRVTRAMTAIVPVVLLGWAGLLFVQDTRVSGQTASATLLVMVLLLLGLLHPWANSTANATEGNTVARRRPAVLAAAAVPGAIVLCAMLGVGSTLLPMNHGLGAPGIAASVEPYVDLPVEYRNATTGELIFTTAVSQTPIVAGQWIYAMLDRTINLLPPESVLPSDRTQREHARILFDLLLDSETTAAIVALRLAGFEVVPQSVGVRIVEVPEESPARGTIQAGDVVTGLNGEQVTTHLVLGDLLQSVPPESPARLEVVRDGQVVSLDVPFMPAAEDSPARFGVIVSPVVTGYDLPFSVQIRPSKVVGGPSAGLMFMLAVYNLVTPEDITHGQRIAGTGTIDINGNVGPIGGVQQKVVAAERAGARYFLVPPHNYAAAAAMARTVQVVQVATAEEAIEFLHGLRGEQ